MKNEMNIILAGDDGRPEVIAVVNTKEDLEKAIKFLQSKSWNYYYVFPIKMNEIYKGPWGIDDGTSWIEEGDWIRNKWEVTRKNSHEQPSEK